MLVMLRKNWPGSTFARSVRNSDGEVVERLVFRAGEAVELTDQQLEAVLGDIDLGTLIEVKAVAPNKVETIPADGEKAVRIPATVPAGTPIEAPAPVEVAKQPEAAKPGKRKSVAKEAPAALGG